MKLKAIAVLAVLFAGLMAGNARAESVNVSSFTVATIVPGNTGRTQLVITNDSYLQPGSVLYFSKYSSSATVTAGSPIASSGTLTLDNYKGPIYGVLEAGATAKRVKYHESLR